MLASIMRGTKISLGKTADVVFLCLEEVNNLEQKQI